MTYTTPHSKQPSQNKPTAIAVQYISQGDTAEEHLRRIEAVCKAGCRWIQLRMKEENRATILHTALKCRELCDRYGALFVINDHSNIAAACQTDGVHLGLEDDSVATARRELGPYKIIGGTANTLEQCQQRIAEGVDYIGLGPFRPTTTKKKLSPVLGLIGYSKILDALRQWKTSQKIPPIYAIGGILLKDAIDLQKIGLQGVAVSGLLSSNTHSSETLDHTLSTLHALWNN